jgi:uncharacterized protein (TIGR02391 family)
MYFASEQLPSAEEIEALPVTDLAMRLLALIVDHGQGHLLSRSAATNIEHWPKQRRDDGTADDEELMKVIGEAWDWLFFHGLLVRQAASREDQQLSVSRRGFRVARDARGLETLQAEERLDVPLHPRIAARVRRQFLLGEYELAAFAAMREVEIRLRELAQAPGSEVGVKLARRVLAPGPPPGPLVDSSLDPGEQVATMELFAGALGVFKNPPSHRQVEFEDATLASEVILFADLLHRMLDRIEHEVLQDA